ncbi:MAG: tetratricopeptide repeat protein [Pseudomonas sp.]|uniref:tetratricopeptide repeat protein n=1 Tax=Pseudomonas sp. TaxID=306 RepID=UPI002736169D|nr:tetratricopeptide repeat protein [Pseudomonas sp.]MDP3844837.1 tetratricopeptide repeat protein [Pseudomonas sp.]
MNETYLLDLAYQRLNNGQVEGAINCLRQLLSNAPEHAEAHALLALCLLEMRRAVAAEREVGLALASDAQLEFAHFVAARVAMMRRKFKLAARHLAQVLEMNPLEVRYQLAQADLQALLGRRAQQLPYLLRALELAPDDPDCLAAMAEFYRRGGEVEQAENFARQALQQHAAHSGAIVTLGHLLLRRGEVQAAREHATWALGEDANDIAALYLISAVKARSNPLMGLWWRYNSWMSELGPTHSIIVLLVMFVVYRVAVIAAGQHGHIMLSQVIQWGWLAFVIYSFAGPQIFKRSLAKELEQVKLSRDF